MYSLPPQLSIKNKKIDFRGDCNYDVARCKALNDQGHPRNLNTTIKHITLALPAYNEAAAIGPLLQRAVATLSASGADWSVIVVDDGSADATAPLVEQFIAAGHPQVRLVRHERNRGLGPAILTGLQSALAGGAGPDRLVVCMDADTTHPPEIIPQMRGEIERGADLVIASRFQPGSRQVGVPLFRQALSLGARLVFHFYLGLPGVRDYTCGFRAFRADLLARGFDHFGPAGLITRSGFACTDELLVHLALLGPVIREVPFILRYDLKHGRSKMNLKLTIIETLKLLRHHRRKLRGKGQGASGK